ncbi:hypothetical protein I6A84_00155, partial [Frankia sp. CNm7]
MADQDRIVPWYPDVSGAGYDPVGGALAEDPSGRADGYDGLEPADGLDGPGGFHAADDFEAADGFGGLAEPAVVRQVPPPLALGVSARWEEPVDGPGGAVGWTGVGAGADPAELDPRVAARRFAALLTDADRARGERAALLAAGREETAAKAERYRE